MAKGQQPKASSPLPQHIPHHPLINLHIGTKLIDGNVFSLPLVIMRSHFIHQQVGRAAAAARDDFNVLGIDNDPLWNLSHSSRLNSAIKYF